MNIEVVNFSSREIQVVRDDKGRPCIALKPIAEALGLDWKSQHRNLAKDPVLNSVMVITTITAADGKNYEMICLPLDYLNGWLFKIDARRYQGERRELIIRYQKECYRVLAEHFMPQAATAAEAASPITLDGLQHQLQAVVEKAAMDDTARMRHELSQYVRNNRIAELGELIELARDVMGRIGAGAQSQYVPVVSGPERWRFGRVHPSAVKRCLERAVGRLNRGELI